MTCSETKLGFQRSKAASSKNVSSASRSRLTVVFHKTRGWALPPVLRKPVPVTCGEKTDGVLVGLGGVVHVVGHGDQIHTDRRVDWLHKRLKPVYSRSVFHSKGENLKGSLIQKKKGVITSARVCEASRVCTSGKLKRKR